MPSICSDAAGLRLIWELRRSTSPFRSSVRAPASGPSVLSARLGELVESGVVERDGGGRYRLSGPGRDLARILYELNRWAERDRGILAGELA